MSRRRRARATSLLVVLFATISLGVCTAVLSAAGKLPCCAKVAAGQASLTACCPTGQQSPSDVPVGFQAQLPQASENAFGFVPPTSAIDPSRRSVVARIPYRSADPQALLSTFLI